MGMDPVTGAIVGSVASGVIGGAMGGGGSQPGSSQTSRSGPDWKAAPYIPDALKDIVTRTQAVGQTPYQAYSGQRVAGLNADEQSAIDLAHTLGTGANINWSQGINQQVANQGLNGPSAATLANYMNPYQSQVMDISRQRQLDQFDLAKRGLQQQQGAIGAFGGSRSAIAQGQLYDNFSRQLAEQEANQLYQGYGDAQNRAAAGAQMAGTAAGQYGQQAINQYQTGQQGISALGAAGALQRGIAQQGLDVGYQDFLSKQQYPYEQLKFESGMINPIAGLTSGQGSTSQVTQTGGPSALMQGIGTGISAYGSGLFQNAFANNSAGGSSMMNGGYANTGFGSTIGNAWKGSSMGGGFYGPGFADGGQVPFGALGAGGAFQRGIQQQSMQSTTPDYLTEQSLPYNQLQLGAGVVNPIAQLGYGQGLTGLGYADGGLVGNISSWLDSYLNSTPHAESGPSTASAPIPLGVTGGMPSDQFSAMMAPPKTPSYIDQLLSQYQTNGGLAGIFADTGEAVGNSGLGQYNKQVLGPLAHQYETDPVTALGTTLMAASGAGALETGIGGLAAGATASAPWLARMAAGAGKLAAKNPSVTSGLAGLALAGRPGPMPTSKQIAQAGMDPQSEWQARMAALPNKSPMTGDMSMPIPLGGISGDGSQHDPLINDLFNRMIPKGSTKAASGTTSGEATATKSTENKYYNSGLVTLGAAILGSKGNDRQALAEGMKAFQTEKSTSEAEMNKRAQQSIKNKLDAYKALMYGKQVENMRTPFTDQVKAAQAKYWLSRAAQSTGGISPNAAKAFLADLGAGGLRSDDAKENALKTYKKMFPTTGSVDDITSQDLLGLSDEDLRPQYLQSIPPDSAPAE